MAFIDNIFGAMSAYLDRDNTEYAIMIDGAWGVGKTHFIIPSLIPARPTTEFIYVSLYGLKTIDEIEAQMQTRSPDVDTVTKIDSWPKIEKQAVGGYHVSSQTRQTSPALQNSNPGHSTVICFDDLERWHGDLDLCLSYVNRLVEHENQKCILVGNLEDQAPGNTSTKFRQLLDTVFYPLDQISLKGLCSISNGYYIEEDFAGDFDGWTTAQQYDLYLDKERFYQLTDHEAQQVFNHTLASLLESRNFTNPVTLSLLAERIISDIDCGVVDYNPIVFQKKFIDMVNALYDSGLMQIAEVSIFDIDGNRFRNCRGLYEHILKRNNDFHLEDQKIIVKGFWR